MQTLRAVWARASRLASPRARRAVAVVAVALVGAWLGLLVGGSVTAPVGPVDVNLSLRPSLTGDTFINVSPLGTVEMDTTDTPLALDASVRQIRVEAAKTIIAHPASLSNLQETVVADLRSALIRLALQSLGCALLGGAVLSTVAFRRPRRTLQGTLVVLVVMLAAYGAGAATWNPRAINEPRYTGLLTSAPQVVGTAQSIAANFGEYSAELARMVTNMSRLYDVTSTLPTYQPSPDTLVALHVSDLHLNPTAWDVIRSVDKQFSVDLVLDTGDLTDHGSQVENRFVREIGTLGRPYVYVKGNHDSEATVRAVARQPNAVVLDGTEHTVKGLRLWGIGDPRFTPDKSTHVDEDTVSLEAFGQQLRPRIEAAGTVDVTMTHDPTVAQEWGGITPLVLAGHLHKREITMLPGGTQMMVEGSTGGAGDRALIHGDPTPLEMDVLYFDQQTGRLQAWDEITLGGLGEQSATIDRHIVKDPQRPLDPLAGQSPTPVPTPTPSGSVTPFTVPPSTPPATPQRAGG